MTPLRLRRATDKDCRMFWEWANDRQVRSAGFVSAPIPWTDHVVWFSAHLESDLVSIYVLETNEGVPAGQVRFEVNSAGEAEIGLSLASEWRGRKLASDALCLACDTFRHAAASTAVAHVKPNNLASVRTFEKAGFRYVGSERVRGQDAIRMERMLTAAV
jgi:UDP-2,4-diacetamido-2,4,6-trideoxy-beta-L-altropyranose hydrolase